MPKELSFRVRKYYKSWFFHRHAYMHVYRRAVGTRHIPLESSRRGGHFEYRHVRTRTMDMPSAMAEGMSI